MRIAQQLYDEIVAHARTEAPNECCGMVASRDGQAVRVFAARNAAPAPKYAFVIDGRDQIEIDNDIDSAGLAYGAIYHSHPRSEPDPSLTDVKYAKWWPGVLWIIVGFAATEPVVKMWEIDDETVREAKLVVE